MQGGIYNEQICIAITGESMQICNKRTDDQYRSTPMGKKNKVKIHYKSQLKVKLIILLIEHVVVVFIVAYVQMVSVELQSICSSTLMFSKVKGVVPVPGQAGC